MNLRHDCRSLAKWALAAVLLAAPGVAPALADESEAVTVSGEVEAAEYDDDGNVTQVAIYDEEWGSVLVLRTSKGAELMNHVGAMVTANGVVRELEDDSGYSYSIEVASYTIDEPAEPEDQPYDDPEDYPEDDPQD